MSPATTTDVVIASFNEDLRWMSWLPDSWRRFVYCTKEGRSDLPEGSVILPNTAREAGQYLAHIARNYDDLADVTLFLQGFPFDHNAPAVIRTLLNKEFPHPICYVGANPPTLGYNLGKPFFKQAQDIFRKAYDVIGEEEIGDVIPFTVGAQFYVRREVVHARPLAFYERLLKATTDEDTKNGFAHVVEGAWGCSFNWKPFAK
jgi:hypothetical protein